MTRLDRFNICASGGYNNTEDYVSWKMVDGIMYFQCSREKEDWNKNFDFRLVQSEVGLTHKGFDEAYRSIFRTIMQSGATAFCGYSHGAVIAARASATTGKKATVFGCPNFMYKPTITNKNKFWNCDFVQNKGDVVADGIFWLEKGRNVVYTIGSANMAGVPFLERLSHHGISEYRQKLKG
jgi:hypothetical protein